MSNWKETASLLSLKDKWKKLYQMKIGIAKKGNAFWDKSDTSKNSKNVIKFINETIKSFKVKSFLDIGCADNYWMENVNFGNSTYCGADIVKDLIDGNKNKYTNKKFIHFNIVEEIPEKNDIVFLRNVFIHLSIDECMKAIKNIKKSGSKYLMASNRPDIGLNPDTNNLMMVQRNLQIKPFNFPKPMIEIEERPDMPDNKATIGMWDISKI